MTQPIDLGAIVEALLFVSDRPLGLREIQEVLKTGQSDIGLEAIERILADLKTQYVQSQRAYQLCEVASGYQLKTLPQYAPYIATLLKEQMRERLSIPALETLAIIAYKQPITRAEVEAIRGVNIDGIIRTLVEKDLIGVVGKKDVPGKPLLLGTSKAFLLHFGLKDLAELPNMEEFKEALVAREKQLAQHRAAAGVEEAGPRETAQEAKTLEQEKGPVQA